MSKKKILDIAAIVIIAAFLIVFFFFPVASQNFMQALCRLDVIMNRLGCDIGRLIFYMIPTVSGMWIVVRGFGKLMHYL